MKKPKLPPETDHYYYYLNPIYDHYKIVKVIERCECCGHKTGVRLEYRGVKVIKWEVKRGVKDLAWHTNKFMTKKMVDEMLHPSPLLERLLNKK